MRISAKTDYALRAMIELSARRADGFVKAEVVAEAQDIALPFLVSIFNTLRIAGLVVTKRGPDGGYRLGLDPEQLSVADIIRVIEGPLANIVGVAPEDVRYTGSTERLKDVWVALRVAMRSVLEQTTLADVAGRALPAEVTTLLAQDGAWVSRPRLPAALTSPAAALDGSAP
ncbi:RrF2 family transcriptional regulator [Nakamurella leprariae]|uniref:Rrf2 family transcriptional regulator n=1 Tax=Nakamurella leprariae TaxID=2803911 RepID=A0A939C0U3_9ACTN|nr:Rrf2 family transcriptional regulator [Nakamurella leprariae]MBM9469585.1 Rrf2 family transcriptional regulator [Nakamurella leprariae]